MQPKPHPQSTIPACKRPPAQHMLTPLPKRQPPFWLLSCCRWVSSAPESRVDNYIAHTLLCKAHYSQNNVCEVHSLYCMCWWLLPFVAEERSFKGICQFVWAFICWWMFPAMTTTSKPSRNIHIRIFLRTYTVIYCGTILWSKVMGIMFSCMKNCQTF